MIRKTLLTAVLLLFAMLVLSLGQTRLEANEAMFTVNSVVDERDDDPGDGMCETDVGNGICTLRAAVQETNALPGPDTIVVPPGTYILTILNSGPNVDENGAATGDLDITEDLTILGANPATTIVEVVNANRFFHIFTPGLQVNISGLTMARNSNIPGGDGGAIWNGGILQLNNVVLEENRTGGEGGSIFNTGVMTINNTSISDSEGFDGGGIYNTFGGTMSINDSEIKGNDAIFRGGGIYTLGTLMLKHVVVEQNKVDPGSSGGGIHVNNGSVTIIDSDIFNNSAPVGNGGGIYQDGFNHTLMIMNSTIRGNMAAGEGGGIFNIGKLWMINSTVSGNNAGRGAGISVDGNGSNQTFLYSTIANNTAVTIERSGIDWNNKGALTTFEGVILSGNGNGDDNCWGINSANSDGFNLDNGSTCGFVDPTDLNNTNPLLGPLADNGGPTLTHALNGLSPAIDMGGGSNCPSEDQRYVFRPSDGDGNGSGVCDIGAYEYINFTMFNFMSAVFKQ